MMVKFSMFLADFKILKENEKAGPITGPAYIQLRASVVATL
jgi:hypothetical protein